MRRIAFCCGLLGVVVAAGCKTPAYDPKKFAAVEVDPGDGSTAAPPGPGDVSRKIPGDRARVSKMVFKNLSRGVTGDGDFAIDQDRGALPFQKLTSVESRIRTIRGFGPGGNLFVVEIRPEGSDCVVIVRAQPKVEEAAALVLLDKVEEDMKAPAAMPPASKS